MTWCNEPQGSWRQPWKSPCTLETANAVVMISITLAVYIVQYMRYKKLQKQIPQDARFMQGMTGSEATLAALSVFIGILHAAHFLYTGITAPGNYPHLLVHAACALSWGLIIHLNGMASTFHAQLDYRPALLAGCIVYTASLYSYTYEYLDHPELQGTQLKLELWTSTLQFSMACVLTVLEFRRHVLHHVPDGYEALPDVEQAQAGSKRSWLRLFLTACHYVWPQTAALQVRVLLCVLLLVTMRVVNLAVPVINKKMTDHFVEVYNDYKAHGRVDFFQVAFPWPLLYLLAIFFQGGMGGGVVGLLNNLRQYLWIPVGQDTFYRISKTTFAHVLDLDLSFHIKRKTGEVTKVVDRGTSAIQNILSTLAFSLGPQLVDVLICSTYLSGVVNPVIALVVFITIGSYMPLTIMVTAWRNGIRRDMNTAENKRSARITDALMNYETIKYHNNEHYEVDAYVKEVADYQKAEFIFTASLNILNVVQSAVMFLGVAAGLLLLCSELGQGQITVGDTVLFISMMAQLYAPLNFFGTYYRIIQNYFVDMENLFDLMDKRSVVTDKPDAKPLLLTLGEVEFDQVNFEYEPGRLVVRELSFKAPGGSTVAFVGPTGSGKSSVTRLLFRFYDPKSGTIRIDGQALTGLTLQSIHTAIGLVPQDCVLFNDTIRHNIRYGRLSASDEELITAADAACIHTTISSKFPKGYDTIVGERGLRLSGGEKQRVAFARALLKNAPILVLDEATSALDSITEKKIQNALKAFRQDRTLLIVAHRLSTIMDADLICVMKDGTIVEKGTHEELLGAGGLYAAMWLKQADQEQEGESSATVVEQT